MYCFVILLLFNEMQMSVWRFSAIPHLRGIFGVERPAFVRCEPEDTGDGNASSTT